MRMLIFILFFAGFGHTSPGFPATDPDAVVQLRSGLRYTTQVALSGRTDQAIRLAGFLLTTAMKGEVIDSAMVSEINCIQGALMIQKGNLRRAIDCFEMSRRYCNNQEQASIIDQDEGTAWFVLGNYEKAMLYFSRALYLISGGQFAEANRVITLYENLCASAIEAGDLRLAASSLEKRRSFERSFCWAEFTAIQATSEKERPVHLPTNVARSLLVRAILSYQRSEADSAICLSLSALDKCPGEALISPLVRAGIHHLLGRSLVLKDRIPEALTEFETGMRVIDSSGNTGELARRMRFLILCDKTGAMVEQYLLPASFTTHSADDIYRELMNARHLLFDMVEDREMLNASLLGPVRDLYEEIFQFCLEKPGPEDHNGVSRLLWFAEERRMMENMIRHPGFRAGSGFGSITGDSLWMERDYYYQRRSYLGIDRIPGPVFLRESARMLDMENRLDSARAGASINNTSKVWNNSDEDTYLDSIRSHLLFGEGVITFINAGQTILTVYVTKDTAICFSFANDDTLSDALGKFRRSLKKAEPDSMLIPGQILRQRLLGPVYSLFRLLKRIYVISDAPLRDLTMELLPAGNGSGRKNRYLLQDLEIAYDGSITGWLCSRETAVVKFRTPVEARCSFSGYAPPPFEGNPCAALKYGPGEIEEITDKFRERGLLAIEHRVDFTGDGRLLEEAGKSSILHIAAHSMTNRDHPGYSGFCLFAGPNSFPGQVAGNDGFLELGEMGLAHVCCDLLVLSSCTVAIAGQGEYSNEYSFPDDLFETGVKNVIYSLWNVSDRHTKMLMVSFYTHLLEGMDYVSALRLAKLDMLSGPATADPWLWGGFILQGR
jgi:CHAT domain-containing protein/tetratricopeptide (TPR) repeat protein